MSMSDAIVDAVFADALSRLKAAIDLNNASAEAAVRAELAALVKQHALTTPAAKGTAVQVIYPYGQRQAGQMGKVVNSWVTPKGDVWARIEFGRNATGQPIRNVYPGSVLRQVSNG